MEINIILLLVWCHFLGDFILQTSDMATKKSSHNFVLFKHTALYSAPFIIFGIYFALVTLVTHFIVDWCTSRVTKKYWGNKNYNSFFTIIGFDQAIHMTQLILTYKFVVL